MRNATDDAVRPDHVEDRVDGVDGVDGTRTSSRGISGGGLTSTEAERQGVTDGPNELRAPRRSSALTDLARRLAEPLNVVLIAAGILTMTVLAERLQGATIVGVACLNGLISGVLERRADDASRQLARLVSANARVQRDGVITSIAARLLVRGDVVHLTAGDHVPADVTLRTANGLEVDESMLTGEAPAVSKQVGDAAFSGTEVLAGSASAVVTATGARTGIGRDCRDARREANTNAVAATAHPPYRTTRRAVGLYRRDCSDRDVCAHRWRPPSRWIGCARGCGARGCRRPGRTADRDYKRACILWPEARETRSDRAKSHRARRPRPGDGSLHRQDGDADGRNTARRGRRGALPDALWGAALSTVHNLNDGSVVVSVKGAPEVVLARCNSDDQHLRSIADRLATQGYKVLAFAEVRRTAHQAGPSAERLLNTSASPLAERTQRTSRGTPPHSYFETVSSRPSFVPSNTGNGSIATSAQPSSTSSRATAPRFS